MDDWRKRIPAWLWTELERISRLATDVRVYLVGGIVRDLLLDRPNNDLDIVIEGDAIAFAEAMQEAYGGSVLSHSRFGTAKWTIGETEIDFVTARAESYSEPAALPTLTRGDMSADLRRRDFSINALALRLDGDNLGKLVDQHHGLADLEMGRVRVLHEQSFIDDPTRIFRAVRYEQRLDFAIEPETLGWLQRDKLGIQRLSGDRIRHELIRIFEERFRVAILARLDELDVLGEVVSGLRWHEDGAEIFARYSGVKPIWGEQADWEVYLLLWLMQIDAPMVVLERLNVGRGVSKSAEAIPKTITAINALSEDARPSQITFALDPFRKDVRALLVARLLLGDSVRGRWMMTYQQAWRDVRAPLNGDDLRKMGMKPGPHFREILGRLRGMVLDTGTLSIDEAVRLVEGWDTGFADFAN